MDDQSFRLPRAVLQAACAVLLRGARRRGGRHAKPMMILGVMPTPQAMANTLGKAMCKERP